MPTIGLNAGFTVTYSDPTNYLGANASLFIRDLNYIVDLLSRYMVFRSPLDLQVDFRPAAQNPSASDGLVPSRVEWVNYNGQWTQAATVKGQTGVDPNGATPDSGFTFYAGNDGTLKNYGSPLWFDPNPQIGVTPSIPNGSQDFISIATHELVHTMGFAQWPEQNAPWNQRTMNAGGVWYYSSAAVQALLGGNLPLDPNEIPGKAGDHYGSQSISYQPVRSGLMFDVGNYTSNRWDIGQLDLTILKDLGWTIQNYQSLPLVDPLDQGNRTGTAGNDAILASQSSSIVSAAAGGDVITLPAGSGNGNYLIDGGAGIDTLVVGRASRDFDLVPYGTDFLLQNKAGATGVSLLRTVEKVQFTDGTVQLADVPVVRALNGPAKNYTVTMTAGCSSFTVQDKVGSDGLQTLSNVQRLQPQPIQLGNRRRPSSIRSTATCWGDRLMRQA